ncbi:UTRA domain-containing protein [Streptomyces sp. NBC_00989]|uniref:GntR family transcriptional regulator n=1 Tax=Streptomyces sp. NBC_00989 TaxID=2903705 RepID=UPI002F91A6BC|nr:UTRA domain-containing protein [Streptomyces sp. NBC_00989]
MTNAWTSTSISYVQPRQPGQVDAWTAEAAQAGKKGGQRLTEVGECVPPEAIAAALRLTPGEPAVVRRRLILEDDQPVELADSYYPTQIARGTALGERGKIPGGAPTLLARLGYTAAEVAEDVSAREASADERAALNLAPGAWVLVLARIAVAENGLPMEAMLMTMRAQDRHLHYQMRVD